MWLFHTYFIRSLRDFSDRLIRPLLSRHVFPRYLISMKAAPTAPVIIIYRKSHLLLQAFELFARLAIVISWCKVKYKVRSLIAQQELICYFCEKS